MVGLLALLILLLYSLLRGGFGILVWCGFLGFCYGCRGLMSGCVLFTCWSAWADCLVVVNSVVFVGSFGFIDSVCC